jgi:hypothetical protein
MISFYESECNALLCTSPYPFTYIPTPSLSSRCLLVEPFVIVGPVRLRLAYYHNYPHRPHVLQSEIVFYIVRL